MKRSKAKRINLTGVLIIIATVCGLCCVAFPRFVGPIDASARYLPFHDPTCRVIGVGSPQGTEAYAEIGAPNMCAPGCMVVNVANNTGQIKDNVIVNVPLDRAIIVDRKSRRSTVSVIPSEMTVRFPSIAAHNSAYMAIDYTYASAGN